MFYLLKREHNQVSDLATAIEDLTRNVHHCSICHNLTEKDPCIFCTNPKRDHSLICVVEEANDVIALERTGEYRGMFHVLGGVLSPLDGIGPEDLQIKSLLARIDDQIKEIIIATNPNTEGEATALYIAKLVKPLEIPTSRIARGIPVGADLEYADEITLSRALEDRVLL